MGVYFYVAAAILIAFIVFMIAYAVHYVRSVRREKNIHRVLRGNR